LIAEAKQRIKRAETVVGKLEVRAAGTHKLHQKKRRLATLKARCAALEADHAAGVTRLCFGSKRLFRAQFDLAANGYASHAQWLTYDIRELAADLLKQGNPIPDSASQEKKISSAVRHRLPDWIEATVRPVIAAALQKAGLDASLSLAVDPLLGLQSEDSYSVTQGSST
jgi:hypothetical protein